MLLAIQTIIEDSSTLSAVSGNGTYGGTATLQASLTSAGLPLAGETVNFSLLVDGIITPVGKATTDASGVAALIGVSLAGFSRRRPAFRGGKPPATRPIPAAAETALSLLG